MIIYFINRKMSSRGIPRAQRSPEELVNEDRGHNPHPMQQFVNLLVGALMNPPVAPIMMFKDFKMVGPP